MFVCVRIVFDHVGVRQLWCWRLFLLTLTNIPLHLWTPSGVTQGPFSCQVVDHLCDWHYWCVCVCVYVLIDSSRVCCLPGLCAGALTILPPPQQRWRCRGESGGFSAALSLLGAAGGKGRGSAGASAKTDDSFSIRAASVSTDIGGVRWDQWQPVTWLGQENTGGAAGRSGISAAGMHQTCWSWNNRFCFSALELLIIKKYFRIMAW